MISMNSAAYCKAKARLPEKNLREIAFHTGKILSKRAEGWNWKGRNVELIDGTIINLEDTKANKKNILLLMPPVGSRANQS